MGETVGWVRQWGYSGVYEMMSSSIIAHPKMYLKKTGPIVRSNPGPASTKFTGPILKILRVISVNRHSLEGDHPFL